MRRLTRLGLDIEVRRAGRRDRLVGRALGYHRTPFLIVLDRERRIRLTSPLPGTPAEHTGLSQGLAAFAQEGR